MFVKLPYECLSIPCTSQKPEIRTGSLERMGPSGKRLTMNELLFCGSAQRRRSITIIRKVLRGTHAEKEPLEVGGHLESLAIVHLAVADE